VGRLRTMLADLPLPRAADGHLVLAVDVSPWLRSDVAASPARLSCHVYGPGKNRAHLIAGWPYSVITALTPWTAVLDAVRLGRHDRVAQVTAVQVRGGVERLIRAGQWTIGDRHMLVVFDAGSDTARLALGLADLPVEMVGRLRSDRVLRMPAPPRQPGRMAGHSNYMPPIPRADVGLARR
jgi:hypothetical protein